MMPKKISVSNKFFDRDSKQSLKNFGALGMVQLTNYLLPLITIPYLIRVLGLEKFGMISVAQAVLLYFAIITDYSFNITTTQEISLKRKDNQELGFVVSKTLVAKTFLLGLSFSMVLILTNSVSYFYELRKLYLFGFLIVLSQTYFPMWFFQGIEKLQYVTFLNFLSRALMTLLIFLVIKTPDDYLLVIPIYSMGGILSSFIGLILIFFKYNLSFKTPPWNEIVKSLKEGFPIFISSVSSNTYTNSFIFFLNIFASELIVGMFAVVDKIILVFRQLSVVFAQSIYPTLCRLRFESDRAVYNVIRSTGSLFLILNFCGSFFLVFFSKFILLVLTGNSDSPDLALILKISSILPPLIGMNLILNQLLLVYNFKNRFMFTSVMFAFISMFLNVIIVPNFGIIGSMAALILTEGIAIAFTYFIVRVSGIYNRLIV